MTPKKAIYVALGSVFLVLGIIGAWLPLLPSVPFFLLTLFFYGRSSQRLHDWFVGTSLYQRNLESYVRGRAMTLRTKLTILGSVTLALGLGFYFMDNAPIGRVVVAIVWILHIVYFGFTVRTLPADSQAPGTGV